MKSKKSYFSKAVFKKDMMQFWSLWAIEIFISIIAFIMPLMSKVRSIVKENADNVLAIPDDVRDQIKEFSLIWSNPIVIGVLAIVVAIVIFHYTFNSRDMYMMHSFPIKREVLFVSHYLAGLIILLIPYILSFISYIEIACVYKTQMVSDIALLAFEVLAMIVLFYSMACTVVMVCGNSMMSIVIYDVANVLYVAVFMMFYSINQMFSYATREVSPTDILENRFIWLSPVIYCMQKAGIKNVTSVAGKYTPGYSQKYAITGNDIMPFVGVFAVGIIIFVISLMMYKYRKSETVGDVVSFTWCKPVFRTVFSITGGVFLALILWVIRFYNTGLSLHSMGYEGGKLIYAGILVLICVSICYFISEMILKKTFFVWKTFSKTNFFAVFGVMFIFLALEAAGLIGVKIPDAKNVSSLEISAYNELLYTDEDDISKFIEIQKEIEDKKLDVGEEENNCGIDFIYTLKNGSKREFSYTIPVRKGSISDELIKCANSSNQKLEAVFSKAYNDENFKLQNVDVESMDADRNDNVWYTRVLIDEKARKKLYDALRTDVADGNIDILNLNTAGGNDYAEIQFKTFVSEVMADKYKMTACERKFFYVNESDKFALKKILLVTKKAKNTMSAITELTNDGLLKRSDETYEEYDY